MRKRFAAGAKDRPEVVLLDQRMPGLTGLATAERILDEDPTQAVVLFSAFLAGAGRGGDAQHHGPVCGRASQSGQARALVAQLRDCAA